MKASALALIALVVWGAPSAHAQAADDDDAMLSSQISVMASCSGYYSWLEGVHRAANQPAQADYVRTFSNGTTLVGGYLLAMQDRLRSRNSPPHSGAYWADALSRRAGVTALRMRALAESGDMASIKTQADICEKNAPIVDSLIDSIRSRANKIKE